MRMITEQRASVEAPLYIRWGPDRSPFAIELRLDLVPRISAELNRAEITGMEAGGVLIGYFTTGTSPILRIDDYEMIPRGPKDGAIFMLDPGQREHFLQIHRVAAARDKTAVGFFRSHFRPGPMRPSLADRSLLSGELKRPNYALLLIQATEPRSASFFVAKDGKLPSEPSVDEFRFGEREFLALPEVQPEGAPVFEEFIEPEEPHRSTSGARIVYTLLIAVILIGAAWWWSNENGRDIFREMTFSSRQINLAIVPEGGLLRINWNHAAADVARAEEGSLRITDGADRETIQLGPDELKFGTVAYQRRSAGMQVSLDLTIDGTTKHIESVQWSGQ